MKYKIKKLIVLIIFLFLINFILYQSDLYQNKMYVYKLLGIEETKGMSLIEEKNIRNLDGSRIKYSEYDIKNMKAFNDLTTNKSKNYNNNYCINDENFKIIMSYLNLDTYLGCLPKSKYTKLYLKNVLNKENISEKDNIGWDFIIIDKNINRLFFVNYKKAEKKLT